MRIVFIQPKVKYPGNSFLPLGIGYLAAFLMEKGHQAKIFDLEVQKISDEELLKTINEFNPGAIGLTATIASAPEAKRLGKIFSERYPWILYGGPQPTMNPEDFLLSENSIVVRGEGELTLSELCGVLSGAGDFFQIRGVSFLKNGKPLHNPERELIKDVNVIPFPARHLYPLSSYEMHLKDKRATNIITSRGCPFECVFCYNMGGRVYRPRSAENVLAELEILKNQYGFGAFSIYDDNFTLQKQRLIDICQGMLGKKMKMAWRCYSRVNTVDEYLLRLMKKAGCFEIAFGVESGSQKSLDLMKKRIKVEERFCRTRHNLCA
ncbi:MAG: Anaerobic magnesium-protoporphyrin IX monomethyl ester cyclase, Elongator protein 3/MiaB/NifB family [Parcubacteria group bacterium GW2011_GWA2_42_35]|nr:MAG: Anaerobic magnesium-protoporphyrin IX monomethyl ester cyclase, Elongator protein 3/MiaB/NifB family [Parcubacteria group bacterium GW2011_GWA2_42_35]